MFKPESTKTVAVLDFESYKVEARPKYPPEPTSFSLQLPGGKPVFYSWGQVAGGNNCTKEEAEKVLQDLWASGSPICFHNAKFDIEVAETHFDLSCELPWDRTHDTMFLLFLNDPREDALGLKPASDKHLELPPDEQAKLNEWIMTHLYFDGSVKSSTPVIFDGVVANIPKGCKRCTKSQTGMFIAYAPGDIVGPYADGDVLRTGLLFDKFYPTIVERGMLAAYQREQKLVRIFLNNEKKGVRVDLDRLSVVVEQAQEDIVVVTKWINDYLNVEGVKIGANNAFAKALEDSGAVTHFEYSKKGNKLLNKNALKRCIVDKDLLGAINLCNKLQNTLSNFLNPWLKQAKATGGWIHCAWNSVRQERDGKAGGAKTGRISSSPNFQNATNAAVDLLAVRDPENPKALIVPQSLIDLVRPIPSVRSFIIPNNPGDTLVSVDWAGQELRVLAHYENGVMREQYVNDPEIDFHAYVAKELTLMMGFTVYRSASKALAFAVIYGAGIVLLAEMLGCDTRKAKEFVAMYHRLLPGLAPLDEALHTRVLDDQLPIRTWGGRLYDVEWYKLKEDRAVKLTYGGAWEELSAGSWAHFAYRMLNILVQGSSGDILKESMINYDNASGRKARFLLCLHDENIINIPAAENVDTQIRILQRAMCDIDLDVPLTTDAESSNVCWSETKNHEFLLMHKYDDDFNDDVPF